MLVPLYLRERGWGEGLQHPHKSPQKPPPHLVRLIRIRNKPSVIRVRKIRPFIQRWSQQIQRAATAQCAAHRRKRIHVKAAVCIKHDNVGILPQQSVGFFGRQRPGNTGGCGNPKHAPRFKQRFRQQRKYPLQALTLRPGNDFQLARKVIYTASRPLSPVRIRIDCSTGITKILPSPILPVCAAF